MQVKNVQTLTPLQEGILFHALRDQDAHAYFEQFSSLINGHIDPDILLKSLVIITERHEALRTRFVADRSSRPVQLVVEKQDPEFSFQDLTNITPAQQEQRIQEFCEEDKKRYFNLQNDSLFRTTLFNLGDRARIVLSFHHIILDGWSFAIVLKELFTSYNSLYNGKEIQFAAPVSFSGVINWLEKQAPKAAAEFWKRHLTIDDQFERTGLPIGFGTKKSANPQVSLTTDFDVELTQQLTKIAAKLQVSINTIAYAIWGILLARYNQTHKAITGITVSGREIPVENATEIVGMCINTIPFAFDVDPKTSISQYIQQTSAQFIESIPFQYYSLADIQQQAGVSASLFDHIVVIEDYPFDELSTFEGFAGIKISSLEVFEETHYPFSVHISVGEKMHWRLAFKTDIYPEALMQQVLKHLTGIAHQLYTGVEENIALGTITLLDEKTADTILNDFNPIKTPYPAQETLVSLYHQRLKNSGATTFFSDQLNHIHLNEFERQTNAIGFHLQNAGVKKGDAIAVCGDRSVGLIASIMAILKCGAVYVPIDSSHPAERMDYVLSDSNAKIMLCYQNPKLPTLSSTCKILHVEDLTESFTKDNELYLTDLKPDDAAYIIYTSGSTGRPKGVIVSHRSVVNHLTWMQETHPLTNDDCLLQKTPASFDVSVWELFHWIFSGSNTYFLTKGDEKDASKICDIILKQKITALHFVPSMLSVFLDSLEEQELDKISHLRYVVASGEALSLATVQQFNTLIYERNHTYLLNLYGPTEATVSCTGFVCSPLDESYGYIPIGKPLANYRIYILDEQKRLLPPWIPGELYIAGISVAMGYNNNIALTNQKFLADQFVPDELMYGSGDAAMWNDRGEIIYLGRLDTQIKLNGQRIELGEIEWAMRNLDGITEVVVVLQNISNNPMLVGYYTGIPLNTKHIHEELLKQLPSYMIPSQVFWMAEMPRLTSGKIDRKSLLFETESPSSTINYQHIQNDVVQLQLLQLWRSVLGKAVHPDKDFFANGGHSLSAIRLLAAIRKCFDLTISLPELFSAPTLSGLATCIKNNSSNNTATILKTAPIQQFYPLMPAQENLYVLQQLPNIGCTYQMPAIITLKEKPDTLKLLAAIKQVIHRHAALRTQFQEVNGNIQQEVISAERAYQVFIDQGGITENSCDEKDLITTWQKVRQKIDIATAPLIKAYILAQSLVLDIHHMVSDEHTNNLLAQEILQCYSDETLHPISFQYPDVSYWYHHSYLQKAGYTKDAQWWKAQLADSPRSIELPSPKKRPSQLSFSGAMYEKVIPAELSAWIHQSALNASLTPFTVLFTAFQVLLSRYALQDDFLVGIPVTNRGTEELNGVAGLLINTLPFRCNIDHDRSFALQLQQTGKQMVELMDHAWYPLAHILQDQQTVRTNDRHPLFSVLFNYISTNEYTPPISDENIITESKFDLSIEIKDQAGQFMISLNYCTEVFDRAYIQSFFNHFQTLIENIRQDDQIVLRAIDLLSSKEKNDLIKMGTGEEVINTYQTLPQILANAYQNYGQLPAIAFLGKELSFQSLQGLTYGIAAKIAQHTTIQKDTVIAICMKRSILTVAAVHAVILSGAAYLPLDPDLPEERIRFMIDDSGAALLVHENDLPFSVPITCCKINDGLFALTVDFKPVHSNDLAYIIYTSGSTGKPKGVLIEHGAIVNRLCWLQRTIPAHNTDIWLWKTAFTFDVSLGELFGWTLSGSKLIVLPSGDEKSPEAIIQTIANDRVTRVHFVASMLHIFLDYVQTFKKERLLGSVHSFFTSGEAVSPELVVNFNAAFKGLPQKVLYNLYGPTETTVELSSEVSNLVPRDFISIGKPGDNIYMYIVHPVTHTLQPLGIPGEVVIGGIQVARGYKNRMVLQHKVFKSDPFKSGQRAYYTGDLGCWMADGTIQFKGRSDHQVKLNGYRIELQEIEKILEQHPLVQKAICLVITSTLVAFIQTDSENPAEEITSYLQQFLPAYMIPSSSIAMQGFPITSSGKTNTKELEQIYLQSHIKNETLKEELSEAEQKLLALYNEVLGKEISVTDDFFAVGGHSILAIKLINRIQKRFEIGISLHDIFTHTSVRALSTLLQKATHSAFKAIPLLPEQPFYNVSPAQRRLWFLQQLQPDHVAYNMTFAFKISGICNPSALRESFQELVNRHDQLRTSFILHDEGPVMNIHANIAPSSYLTFHEQEINENQILHLAHAFSNRPFTLNEAPLFRVLTASSSSDAFYVFLNMHHIITDGWSMSILLKELAQLYQSNLKSEKIALPSISVRYTDSAAWLQQQIDENRTALTQYWTKRMDKDLQSACFPTLATTTENNNQGKTLHVNLQEETVQCIRVTAKLWNCTENQLMLYSYALLLANLSERHTFVFGISVSGRSHPDMENVVGFFVNMLPIVVKTDGTLTVKAFFDQFVDTLLDDMNHQALPFDELAALMQNEKGIKLGELISSRFVYNDFSNPISIVENDLKIEELNIEMEGSKFDLSFTVQPHQDTLTLNAEYKSSKYDEKLILSYIEQWEKLIVRLCQSPEVLLQAFVKSKTPVANVRQQSYQLLKKLQNLS